jgi:uncharacterized repeat protein (TIGR03943 family)
VNAGAQGVVLLLLGGAVLRATFTDLHTRYVKASLEPFLIGAGALLVVAALITLYQEMRRDRSKTAPDGSAPDGSAPDEHGHGGHGMRIGWLLILPAVGLLLVAPPALGSYAAEQSGTALSADWGADDSPLPAGDPVDLRVLDYASRAVFDKGSSLGDRRIQLTGFLIRGQDGAPFLARMVLSCCAADGRPIKVGLSGNSPAGQPADTWVRVVGRYTDRAVPDPVNGEAIPYLEVESWERVRQPDQPYE